MYDSLQIYTLVLYVKYPIDMLLGLLYENFNISSICLCNVSNDYKPRLSQHTYLDKIIQ